MQEVNQEKEQEKPEENKPVEGVEDPSLVEDQTETEEAEQVEEQEEESETTEEETEEEPIEAELIQKRGCLWGCLIPLATIVAVVLVIITIGYSRRDVIHAVLLKRIVVNTQNHVLSKLPQDMDDKAIETAFEEVKTALKENRLDKEALTEAIEEYHGVMRNKPPEDQERQEIDKLMTALKAAVIVPIE